MITLDTETCGLHGVAVLLQYARDWGDIVLWNLWKEPVEDTIAILESIADDDVCGFNLAFDWFHIQKIYTMFCLFRDRYGNQIPEDFIDEIAELEKEARTYDVVLKPRSAMDLMLHARKGKYQALMARKSVKVRKVPNILAGPLAAELESRIDIDPIYFSKRKNKNLPKWSIQDCDEYEFKDVVLKFNASTALKVLAKHVLKVNDTLAFADVELPKSARPYEKGWAPFCLSTKEKNWRVRILKSGKEMLVRCWPALVQQHIDHWAYNKRARGYASDDVDYTRRLWDAFDRPEFGDDDSELACMVGAVRWRGFKINIPKLLELKAKALKEISQCPIAPKQARMYLHEVMNSIEQSQVKSTKRVILEEVAKWECDCLLENRKCDCGGQPAAIRAQEILDARKAIKQIEIFDKLLEAERFHASFKVIGTLSSRMAGSDGLNPQGINHTYEVRDCFDLADDGFQLDGGDFESFEVVLAEAIYDDAQLRKDLTTEITCFDCNGKGCKECKGKGVATYKMHALFGMAISGLSYSDVMKSKGSKTDTDWYALGKAGVFAMIYGGDWQTLVKKQGIDPELAQKAEADFVKKYEGIKRARAIIYDEFCSMRQPGGIGTKVIWAEPKEYVESLFGFKRFFTLENEIAKQLFILANNLPPKWKMIKQRCTRRDKEQSVSGALSSAIYAAAFQIQAANMRAAANHKVQSSGATITKSVQRRIWDIQPIGANPWRVVPMNVHDEIACPVRPAYSEKVATVVSDTVESFRPQVPLINIEWAKGVSSWATMK